VPTRHDLDHDAAVLDPLDGLVTGVDPELLADALLEGDLAPLSDSTGHSMNLSCRYDYLARVRNGPDAVKGGFRRTPQGGSIW
jgi:hypothetical protein